MDCKDAQWEAVGKLLESIKERNDPRGRPAQDLRAVFNGILWVCRTGAPWQDLPRRYPPYQTCHRYFQNWCRQGAWDRVLWELALDLKRRGKIDITECFIDGTFSSAKKGGVILDRLSEAKASRSWSSQTLMVFLSPYGPSEQAPMR
jgi:transposase